MLKTRRIEQTLGEWQGQWESKSMWLALELVGFPYSRVFFGVAKVQQYLEECQLSGFYVHGTRNVWDAYLQPICKFLNNQV